MRAAEVRCTQSPPSCAGSSQRVTKSGADSLLAAFLEAGDSRRLPFLFAIGHVAAGACLGVAITLAPVTEILDKVRRNWELPVSSVPAGMGCDVDPADHLVCRWVNRGHP